MEIVTLLPWMILTLATSLIPALFAKRFAPWWQRHGDIGEAIGISLVAGTAIFTVVIPIFKTQVSLSLATTAVIVGILLALLAHFFFEKDGEEKIAKSWFVAISFALHNFPEGVASAQSILALGTNVLSVSILSHNIFDAIVMTLGLMSVGARSRKLFIFLAIAAFGEVAGMFVASFNFSGLIWISLLSVGALLGLAFDSISHWTRAQTFSAMITIVLIGITLY